MGTVIEAMSDIVKDGMDFPSRAYNCGVLCSPMFSPDKRRLMNERL